MDLAERPAAPPPRRHPWEVARLAFLRALLRREGILRPGLSVLDVGAGDAWLASRLADDLPGGRLACWDAAYRPGQPSPDPRLELGAAEPGGAFDLLLLLDVAEHVADDRAFVAGLAARRLRPGGHLLFTVPAWPGLFSSHDERLRHHRRYAPAAARGLLEAAGLEVRLAGGLFHSLLLPRALQRVRERLGGAAAPLAGAWRGGPLSSAVLGAALSCDTAASLLLSRAGWSLPGLSWWALCRKPSSSSSHASTR